MSREEILRERRECAATVRAMARFWPGNGLEWAARAIEARPQPPESPVRAPAAPQLELFPEGKG